MARTVDSTPTGQDEARRALAWKIESARARWSDKHEFGLQMPLAEWDVILSALRATSPDRGAEEWQPIADKPPEADWIVYLPDGAEDGVGWALDPDERLAALLWWKATSPTLSEITHFRKPIAGPSALAQQAKGEGGGDG